MKRRFRLTRSQDLKRVRQAGKSYTHPLVVLYVIPAERPWVRVGVTASRGVGSAVRRNRAKRLLRAAVSALLPDLQPGFDLLLIARTPLAAANMIQTKRALAALLSRAGLLTPSENG
ncbi:MAG: ribonuclease P protein component [Anaerolineales bacterium]